MGTVGYICPNTSIELPAIIVSPGSGPGLANLQVFCSDQNGSILKTDVPFSMEPLPGTWGEYAGVRIEIQTLPAEVINPAPLRIVSTPSAEIPSGGLGTPPPQPVQDVGGSEIVAAPEPSAPVVEIAPAPEEPNGNPAPDAGPASV